VVLLKKFSYQQFSSEGKKTKHGIGDIDASNSFSGEGKKMKRGIKNIVICLKTSFRAREML